MTLPTVIPPAGDTGQQDLPFQPAPVEELLRLLVKAVRAHQLYLPNNPVYKGAVDALRNAFAPIWQLTDQLPLKFTESEVRWYGRAVLVEGTKSPDSLPWTFFKDGIREIQLSPGFEREELATLLDILQRIRKASPDEDDLLTMLWVSDFTNLRYRYVDLGAEPAAPLADGPEMTERPSADRVQAGTQEAAEPARADLVSLQDFDATLYFLDEQELDYLRKEIEAEYRSDLRQNVIAILLDIYEAQTRPAIREELGEILESMMLSLLAAGQLRTVAYLLAETQVALKRAPEIMPEQHARIGQFAERLSAAEPLAQMLQALDESADLPQQAELTELFQHLRPAALGTIFGWLLRLQNPKIVSLVEQAAERLAAATTGELMALISSNDRVVAREAIRRAGAMRAAAAVVPLAKVLNDGEVSLRQAAVQALIEIGSAGAMQALERSIEDPDRDVRVAAVRALGTKSHKAVLGRLEAYVKGKAIREANLTEKMAYFEAYGALCGDSGVPYLDGILNGKGMFGKREDPELRACAAMALGRIGTSKAQDALRRSSSEKDIVVRNAVNRALRVGTT